MAPTSLSSMSPLGACRANNSQLWVPVLHLARQGWEVCQLCLVPCLLPCAWLRSPAGLFLLLPNWLPSKTSSCLASLWAASSAGLQFGTVDPNLIGTNQYAPGQTIPVAQVQQFMVCHRAYTCAVLLLICIMQGCCRTSCDVHPACAAVQSQGRGHSAQQPKLQHQPQHVAKASGGAQVAFIQGLALG